MGVRAGIPDFIIFDWMVAIELKVGNNKLTNAQRECRERLIALDWDYYVCRNIDEFIKAVER